MHQSGSQPSEVRAAIATSKNATTASRKLLVQTEAGKKLSVYAVASSTEGSTNYTPYIKGHIAAHAAENASAVGYVSAALAASETVAATGLTAVSALTKSPKYRRDARNALTKAESLISKVTVENNKSIDAATKASITLLARVAHDSSVILYWPTQAKGKRGDGKVFNETIVFINGLLEPGSRKDIVEFTKAHVANGANRALALTMLHVVIHELLGAIYTYRGDIATVVFEQYEASTTVLQAIKVFESKTITFNAATFELFYTKTRKLLAEASTVARRLVDSKQYLKNEGGIDDLLSSIRKLDEKEEDALANLR